ncbi:MAG TPA: hypothetical protein VEI49_10880 [Terriglobales bacterium]|nr:hypothetical protein [Terriglobales bacterium]
MGPSALGLLSLLILSASASVPQFAVPDFPDLTIKTRRSIDDRRQSKEMLYLKGPRQRSVVEIELPHSNGSKHITITQCDLRRRYSLDENFKTYASFPILDWQERLKQAQPARPVEMSGKEVVITVEAIDTGDRRNFGKYQARRVKTTTEIKADPGAATQSSVTEVDGWYIDLPGFGCQEQRGLGIGVTASWVGDKPRKRDRIVVKQTGKAPRGYPLEEVSRKTEAGQTGVSRIELLEFSEAPIEDSLFELPESYRPALHTPFGGRDMTKPDTLGNRLQTYWNYYSASARRWFHSLG